MRRILLLGIIFTLAACGRNEAVDPPTSSVAGSYELTMVDGHDLPLTLLDLGAYQVQLVSGSLNLHPDGTYSQDIGYRIIDSGNQRTASTSDTGAWNDIDQAITLASSIEGGISRTGTVSGDRITLQSADRVLEFRKQRGSATRRLSTPAMRSPQPGPATTAPAVVTRA
jgi:hypothetical protein